MVNYKKRVANGVEWLNKNHSGWKREINVSILNMNQYDLCILGQLFDDYANAERFLGESFCIEHGFKYSDNTFNDDSDVNNRLLDKEWEAVLEETFDLSRDKVKPGLYQVIDPGIASGTFKPNDRIMVIEMVCGVTIVDSTSMYIINNVLCLNNNTVYINCPIIVKRVKEST